MPESITTDLDFITVWIVDDEENIRLILCALINETPDLRCTQDFSACESALQKLEETAEPPDVILLDIKLPGMSGLDALRRFKQISPDTHVIMWTGHDTETNIANGVSHHASGFLRKTEDPAKIIEAIRAVMDGGMPMDPIVVRKLVEFAHLVKDGDDKWDLTEREQEFSALLAQGFTIGEIANRKNVSVSTVRTHRDNIYRKLGIHNRVQLFRKTAQKSLQ